MLPTWSPVIWTSIATGKKKEEHGIEHFSYTEQGDAGEITRSYTSGHRKVKALDLDTLPPVGDVLDVLPTLLALKAVPLAEDLAGGYIE